MSAQGTIANRKAVCRNPAISDLLPFGVRLYLSHVGAGKSLRALGKDHGCHASTVLRQVRHFENRRDDPLVDDALRRLDDALRAPPKPLSEKGVISMTTISPRQPTTLVDPAFEPKAMQVLQHLSQAKSVLIVALDMPKAVVTCDDPEGVPQRVCVLDRCVAEVMALNDWISCRNRGRVASYVISPLGRSALRRYCAQHGLPFAPFGTPEPGAAGRLRYGGTESPVTVLARRRDKNGQPFLGAQLVLAAARLREDFVMAQLETSPHMTTEDAIAALENRTVTGPNIAPPGTKAARLRVLEVLRDLGPELGDVALRCCCRLEGVESAEQALGWSARSGKIVLRIALQRLSRHYQRMGDAQMMIG